MGFMWFLINMWLLFSLGSAWNHMEYDEEHERPFTIPNIYTATIDGSFALLAQRNSRDVFGGSRKYKWTNVNLETNKIIWSMSYGNCKTNTGWPKSLTLKGPNPMSTIPKEIFRDLPVKNFGMHELGLTSISKEDFKDAYFLESINLSNNTIVVVPSFVFVNTPIIHKIDLSNNDIEHIADDAFERDSSINPYVDFPYYCKEEHERLLYEKDVKYLSINSLSLDNNRLTVVNPKWFKSLKYLSEISLGFNRVHTIDALDVFSENLKLNSVTLKNNLLTDLTKLQFNSYLEQLNIANNPVETPNNICANSSKTILWNLRHDETSLTITSTVYILDAGNNSITSIIAGNTSAINSLSYLKLDNNKLSSISNISAFGNLEVLILAKNLLTTFDSSVFEQLPRLKQLDLSYNQLTYFELNVKMPDLQELRIAGNGLTTIDTNLKNMAPNLIGIGLKDNNWNCQYLTTTMLLLHSDGIRPVLNGSTDTPESYNQIKYDGSVKGVKCFNNVKTTIGLTNVPEDISVNSELKDEVQQLLDEKLINLQEKLIAMLKKIGTDQANVINDKFNKFSAALGNLTHGEH